MTGHRGIAENSQFSSDLLSIADFWILPQHNRVFFLISGWALNGQDVDGIRGIDGCSLHGVGYGEEKQFFSVRLWLAVPVVLGCVSCSMAPQICFCRSLPLQVTAVTTSHWLGGNGLHPECTQSNTVSEKSRCLHVHMGKTGGHHGLDQAQWRLLCPRLISRQCAWFHPHHCHGGGLAGTGYPPFFSALPLGKYSTFLFTLQGQPSQ